MSSKRGERAGLALFGLGRVGEIHLRNILRERKADLKWIVEEDLSHAQEVVEKKMVDTCVPIIKPEDSDKVFNDSSALGIMICTPTSCHEDLVKKGLKSGKAVFCEKPIADTVESTKACYADAEKYGQLLFCAMNRRFDPSVRLMKQRMTRGDIGQAHSITACYRDCPCPPIQFLKTSGGLFHDCGVHYIDIICWIMGEEPVSVYAQAHAFHDEIAALGDVDQATIVLKFPSGCTGTIELSRLSVYGYDQRFEIFGSEGMLEQQNKAPTSVVHHSNIGTTHNPIEATFRERYRESFELELVHFLNAVLGIEKELSVKKEDVLRACRIADACKESHRTGQQIFLNNYPYKE